MTVRRARDGTEKDPKIGFDSLLSIGYDVDSLVRSAECTGDEQYIGDAKELSEMIAEFAVDYDEDRPLPSAGVQSFGRKLGEVADEAMRLNDSVGLGIIDGIREAFPMPTETPAKRRSSDFPTDPEEARKQAIGSYKELVDKMFSNIERDLVAGIKASKALAATGKICDEPEDRADGEYMVQMLEALKSGAQKMKGLYKERFGDSEISEAEWRRLD